MSGVVLRCPSCGTTKAAPGECEACHEAQVRYYCTNHRPGRWLESQACPQCGSQFGVADPPPAAPSAPGRAPPRAFPPPPTSTTRPPTSATTPPGPTARRKGFPSWPAGGPWGSRTLPRDEREPRPRRDALRETLERTLPELLREAAHARRSREVPEVPPIGVAVAGCLRGALLLVLFFMLALFAMSMFLGGAFIY
jgi:hypothetical protein